MAVLENKTGFAGELFTAYDERGHLYVVLAVRGTFDIRNGGVLNRSEAQDPVCTDDVHYGEPGTSSIKFASDLNLLKPGTDVALLGTAHAPGGKPVRQMTVELQVGSVHKKALVFGNRTWSGALGLGASITRPEPFVEMPLIYERAFGGSDTTHDDPSRHDWERRNPVGSGFRAHKPVNGLPLPNVEAPDALISSPSDRPPPHGFGFIDRHWQPRASFAGTCDEKWQQDQCPLLPVDFDPRYFHTVQADQTCRPHLRGDEPVRVVGAVPEGVLAFWLPAVVIGLAVQFRNTNPQPGVALLDAVIVRPDERKVNLVWRSTIRCPRKIFDVELVTAFALQLKTALHLIPALRGGQPYQSGKVGW